MNVYHIVKIAEYHRKPSKKCKVMETVVEEMLLRSSTNMQSKDMQEVFHSNFVPLHKLHFSQRLIECLWGYTETLYQIPKGNQIKQRVQDTK